MYESYVLGLLDRVWSFSGTGAISSAWPISEVASGRRINQCCVISSHQRFLTHEHLSIYQASAWICRHKRDVKPMCALYTLTESEGLSLYYGFGLSYPVPIFRPCRRSPQKTFVECALYSATNLISNKCPRSIHLRLPNQTLNLFLPNQLMLLLIPVSYLNFNHEFPALQL